MLRIATRAGSARVLRGAVYATALMLGACAVGPTYRLPAPPPALPAAYANAVTVSDTPADSWWTAFGDPVLDQLVGAALADNPGLAAAEARVREARELASATGAAFLPAAGAFASVSRDQLSRNGENLSLIPFTPPRTAFTDYQAGLDVSWEIDLFGRTRHEVDAAVARFGSAAETRNDARVVVAAEVVSAYVDERTAGTRLTLATRYLAIAQDAATLVHLSAAAGLASVSDTERADADLAAARGAPALLAAEREAARARLVALTGRAPADVAATLDAPGLIPVPAAAFPAGQPSDLLRRRPDVRRAERELAAATADEGAAVAARFPRVSLTGTGGLDSIRPGDLLRTVSHFWHVAPALSVPLFNGGQLRHQAQAAGAAREAALASYQSVVLLAFADADGALARLAGDQRNAEGLAASAAATGSAYRRESARFRAGDISRLELLADEQAANRADDRRASAAGALALDYAALNKALGGGWQTGK